MAAGALLAESLQRSSDPLVVLGEGEGMNGRAWVLLIWDGRKGAMRGRVVEVEPCAPYLQVLVTPLRQVTITSYSVCNAAHTRIHVPLVYYC